MLLMLGKAVGIITIAITALYFGMVTCVNYAHDALDSGQHQELPPELRQYMPEESGQTQAVHPQMQKYMPQRLGNDPEHPVARLLNIDQRHTANWVPDTPEITFQVQRIIDGDTILAHTS